MHGETLAGKDGATMAALEELAVLTWVARFVICVSVNAVVCEAKSSGSGMWERLLGTETMEAGRDSGPGKRPQGPVPPHHRGEKPSESAGPGHSEAHPCAIVP